LFVCCSNVNTPTTNDTYLSSADIDRRRAKLLYQSRKRGIREMDFILGFVEISLVNLQMIFILFCRKFADTHLNQLTEQQLNEYDKLINGNHNEWDVYYWITGELLLCVI
jgi:succinate dehydrogenase assembly factor 2